MGSARTATVGSMNFSEYFTASSVVPNLTSENKLEAIQELITTVRRYRRLPDGDLITERVLEREALDSTGIGHGVAIPHARIPALNRIVCAVGRHREGLNFDSIDGGVVNLVFLILYPPKEAARYLFIISALTRMLLHDGLTERLLQAPDDRVLEALLETAAQYTDSNDVDDRTVSTATILPPTSLNPEVSRLIRLQRLEDQRPAGARTNPALETKVAHVRSCIGDRVLRQYDKLRRRGGLAIVASEAGICQGCHMQFSTSFAQELRATERLATCPSCSRYLYVVS